ncbi:MAG: hypothetical protein ABFC89_02175 [Methanospirillum sp.]
MGRVFMSPRMGVLAAADRWRRLGRGLREGDRTALARLAGMAGAHSSEGFFAFNDPLEASIVSVMLEFAKEVKGP